MIYNSLYQTHPIVVHKPGRNNVPIWDFIIGNVFRKTKVIVSRHDLTIVTWNNSQKKALLERCLDNLGVDYITLGRGVSNWINPMKISSINAIWDKIKTKYVMGLDSFDVLLLSSPDEIVERFMHMDCDLLYNCGPIDHPPIKPEFGLFEKKIAPKYHPFPYLNAGVWVGKTNFCKEFYITAAKAKDSDNIWWTMSEQVYIKSAFSQFYPRVKLDYNCEIFQILHPMSLDNSVCVSYGKLFV